MPQSLTRDFHFKVRSLHFECYRKPRVRDASENPFTKRSEVKDCSGSARRRSVFCAGTPK